MEIIRHARISQRRWGGEAADYFPIHRLIDSTKALCSDNRHRVLHTHWAVKEIVVPIFGEVFVNSAGREVDVKRLCEQDHLLVDFKQFIPTLADFVRCLDEVPGLESRIDAFHQRFAQDDARARLLLSPLAVTGQLKSLLITHNSWFVNAIVPRVFGSAPILADFDLTPDDLFHRMRFDLWMENGSARPPSAASFNNLSARASRSPLPSL
ncbi:MAG: hypothetical protein KDI71_16995 [Xanthomonadales bacterium]|nr:hypothetical protein [Xanthomonadales bacterium]